ncbi:MAG: hypothetical protein PHP98_09130 [Kiritimatiellae bacterium]|nr:hypothetical protein [Kiritimatiellia bacterium]
MADKNGRAGRIYLNVPKKGAVWLAAQRLVHIAKNELNCRLEIGRGGEPARFNVAAMCFPWKKNEMANLQEAEAILLPDGRLKSLEKAEYGAQGFIAARLKRSQNQTLLLAANTPTGLKNALLTLCDRLYRDAEGNVVIYPFEGVHKPAFESRHIKTDAMNCGRFRATLEYWRPASQAGVNEFADWLASFRLTDYNLLAFVRGWGLTYASEKFPLLADPQHPNVRTDFYPQLLERLHEWGIRTWASDIYMASGYSMETGTCPEILSPCAVRARLRPFKAGKGSFRDILSDPNAITCLSHPSAARFYADVVAETLERYPALDGLDFHIGHAFPSKICRCPQCGGLDGNRELVYRCFVKAYETAVGRKPGIRMRTAVKMFGDATRKIVEHCAELPNLELFCWFRWLGNYLLERTELPVTTGHEDGGGGLEASESNSSELNNLPAIRDYYRDYEPWLGIYVNLARKSALPSISWEPILHREMEQQFFLYSQLTWEPDLSWAEFAGRFVIRSERRWDAKLVAAYCLALEANAAVTSWGLTDLGHAQGVMQTRGLLETPLVRGKIASLRKLYASMNIADYARAEAPAIFNLRHSLAKTIARLQSGKTLRGCH